MHINIVSTSLGVCDTTHGWRRMPIGRRKTATTWIAWSATPRRALADQGVAACLCPSPGVGHQPHVNVVHHHTHTHRQSQDPRRWQRWGRRQRDPACQLKVCSCTCAKKPPCASTSSQGQESCRRTHLHARHRWRTRHLPGPPRRQRQGHGGGRPLGHSGVPLGRTQRQAR